MLCESVIALHTVETIILDEHVFAETFTDSGSLGKTCMRPSCNLDNTLFLLIYMEQFVFSCGIILDSVS